MSKEDDSPAYLYCAGLYEGEGNICCTYTKDPRNGNRNKIPVRKLVLKISMTDREPLELFEDIMQVGNLNGVGVLPSGKRLYEYRVGKFEEVKLVIDRMYDWLSPRRKKQADDAFSSYLEKGPPRRKGQ